MKLAQYLARSGLGSRRKMEVLVKSGRVLVDDTICTDQSREVGDSTVRLDGTVVRPAELVYFAWHKPRGVTTTFSDVHASSTLSDSLPDEIRKFPVFAVGRLDKDTEGLLILTTDGAWGEEIIHPRGETEKVYRALIHGEVPQSALDQMQGGVTLEDGPVYPKEVVRSGREGNDEWLLITLVEGRNRVVRRMIDSVGLELRRLVRVKIADIELGDLAENEFRQFTPEKR